MKSIPFTTDEKKLLIEVLLFAGMTDICSEWTPKQMQDMVALAKRLNEENIKLDDIYLFEGGDYDAPKLVEEVIAAFPNLPRTSIITD